MRTKVVSILFVLVLYIGAYVWSLSVVPIAEECTTPQWWALTLLIIFAIWGLILGLYHTIKWLISTKKEEN